MQKKILYVLNSAEGTGGAEISLRNLALKLKSDGNEIIYACPYKYKDFKTYTFKKFKSYYTFELYNLYLSRFLMKVIDIEKPDIIHGNDRFTIIPAIMAAKKRNIPVVAHFRDFSFFFPTTGLPYSENIGYPDHFDFKMLLKTSNLRNLAWNIYKYLYIKRKIRLINSADAKIMVSKVIQRWAEMTGLKNTVLIPNPIVDDYLRLLVKKVKKMGRTRNLQSLSCNHPLTKKKIVSFVGGLSKGKGIEIVIEIMKRLKDDPKIHFIIAGSGEYSNQINSLNLTNCTYLGKISHDKVFELYAVSAIVLFPSKFEPLGRVPVEAISLGVPVIGSNKGGIPEVIENNVNGILVDPLDIEGWCKAIKKCISQDYGLKFMKKSNKIFKEYSAELSSKRIINIYNKINSIKNP